MKYIPITMLLFISVLSVAVIVGVKTEVRAAPITDFNPGKIIDDSVFINPNSMTPSQIQTFLNSKLPTCDTWGTKPYGGTTRAEYAASRGVSTPFTCLKTYSEGGRVAAQIIYDVAQKYAINPQVLIVLLQKEQGLVTDDWPWPTQYRTATGYGCPDTAPCDSQYYGLTNQLDWAARMFRSIMNDSPDWYTPYILGNNYIRWNPNAACGGTNVYIQNRSTQALYNYTPYQPNQAALNAGYGNGDSCSAYGNRNFYLYFRDWFGYNRGPAAFKTEGSSTIYVPVENYKLSVPHMAALQDYGISSESIATVSQAYVDNFSTPGSGSGISTSIGHIVKSPVDTDEDGGSIYLISRGKRYQIQTMGQFNNFGFSEANIKYLPLGYLFSLESGGMLSDFVSSPTGNSFKVTNNTKRIIFEYSTYIAQNPSDQSTPLSYYLADAIPSGTPITSRPVLIKMQENETVTLYQNDSYYSIPDFTTFSCWNLDNNSVIPVYKLSQSNYVGTFTPSQSLSCLVGIDNTTQVLNNTIRFVARANSGLVGTSVTNDLRTLLNSTIPLRDAPLRAYARSNVSPAVWFIDSGVKRLVPSYETFKQLGLAENDIDWIPDTVLTSIPSDGIKLADGQLVKTSDSSAVYMISKNERVLYGTGIQFMNYLNDWNKISVMNSDALNGTYPFQNASIKDLLVDKESMKTYLVSPGKCYFMNTSQLSAMGKTYANISSLQQYEASFFKSLKLYDCVSGTYFMKAADSNLVYWLDGGEKHPLTTYQAMLNRNGGAPPHVMTAGSELLSEIQTGATYSQ